MLEVAYGVVYPSIPTALAIYIAVSAVPNLDRFWAVMVITDYICFGCLPWIRTRPPRPRAARSLALEGAPLQRVPARRREHPREHVPERPRRRSAGGRAHRRRLSRCFWNDAGVCPCNQRGAIFGRYHYALDALTGLARRARGVALAAVRLVDLVEP